jgi:hypothetical protein
MPNPLQRRAVVGGAAARLSTVASSSTDPASPDPAKKFESVDTGRVACMFDSDLPDPAVVSTLGDVQLVDAILSTSKLEAQVQARRLSAVGELWDRRKQQAESEADYFVVDTMHAVSAEIAAAIGVTSSRAAGLIRVGEALRGRLPKVAAVFARGDIDMAMSPRASIAPNL